MRGSRASASLLRGPWMAGGVDGRKSSNGTAIAAITLTLTLTLSLTLTLTQP